MEFLFMCTGFSILLISVLIVLKSSNVDYMREVREMREFGFRFTKKDQPQETPEPK